MRLKLVHIVKTVTITYSCENGLESANQTGSSRVQIELG